MKICNKCKVEKPIEDFSKNKQEKDGHQYICKKCATSLQLIHYSKNKEPIKKHMRDYSRKRQTELKKQIIETLGGKCLRCGFSDSRALQVDHIKGGGYKERKDFGNGGQTYKRYLQSIKMGENKYQLLCANCNSIKMIEDKTNRNGSNAIIISI